MPALIPIITDAGLQAAIDADNAGIQIYIDGISFGDGLYDPTGTETALVNQHTLVPIASGGKVGPTQLRVSAVWQEEFNDYNIGEIGFWTGATLFAVWSRAVGGFVAVKDAGIDFVSIYDLALSAVPPNSVSIIVNTEVNEALAVLAEHLIDPNAHPASAITFSQGRTVQAANDSLDPAAVPANIAVGVEYLLKTNGTSTLPSTVGLPDKSKVYLRKIGSVNPIIQVNNPATEQLHLGKGPEYMALYDSFIYSINSAILLIWDADNSRWEMQ